MLPGVISKKKKRKKKEVDTDGWNNVLPRICQDSISKVEITI